MPALTPERLAELRRLADAGAGRELLDAYEALLAERDVILSASEAQWEPLWEEHGAQLKPFTEAELKQLDCDPVKRLRANWDARFTRAVTMCASEKRKCDAAVKRAEAAESENAKLRKLLGRLQINLPLCQSGTIRSAGVNEGCQCRMCLLFRECEAALAEGKG